MEAMVTTAAGGAGAGADTAPPARNGAADDFSLFVRDETDRAGMIAYGRHRFALDAWRREFAARHGREPTGEETDAARSASAGPAHVEALRQAAAAQLAVPSPTPAAGPAGTAAARSTAAGTTASQTTAALASAALRDALPRLLARLALLGVAVVVTALLVRYLLWS